MSSKRKTFSTFASTQHSQDTSTAPLASPLLPPVNESEAHVQEATQATFPLSGINIFPKASPLELK